MAPETDACFAEARWPAALPWWNLFSLGNGLILTRRSGRRYGCRARRQPLRPLRNVGRARRKVPLGSPAPASGAYSSHGWSQKRHFALDPHIATPFLLALTKMSWLNGCSCAEAIYNSLTSRFSGESPMSGRLKPSRLSLARRLRARLNVEQLEARTVPSAYSPGQIRHAYGIDQVWFNGGAIKGDGAGQTIAIV